MTGMNKNEHEVYIQLFRVYTPFFKKKNSE